MRLPPWSLVLLCASVAGCASGDHGPGGSEGDIPAFPAMDVATTATEPFEFRGFIRVAWAEGVFAIDSQIEPGFTPFTVVTDDAAYTSRSGMGWVVHDLDPGLRRGVLTNRLVAWDLPALLARPELEVVRTPAVDGTETWTAKGTAKTQAGPIPLELEVRARGGTAFWARMVSDGVRESPFTFTPAVDPMRFQVTRPPAALVKEADEVLEKDGQAEAGHALIVQWVRSYATTRGGLLPESLDPQTLRLEMLQTGGSWPESPYDGESLQDVDQSGHFAWSVCSLRDGRYVGYGWDGALRVETLGPEGCDPSEGEPQHLSSLNPPGPPPRRPGEP